MLTPSWTPLKYHALQTKLWRTKAQFVAVAAGRGSGKTELARRRVVRFLPIKKDWPDPIYFYALPTIKQAKRVAWNKILHLVPKEWIKKVNITDMTISTIFGSTLYVLGMDQPQRIEGDQWDGGVLDESCDQKPKVFDLSVLPALTHKNGWCWRIGVPKRHGIGSRDFKRFYNLGAGINDEEHVEEYEDDESEAAALQLKSAAIESYSWPSKDILSPQQLAWSEANLDPRDFNEQYNATWETASGAIFYAYKDVEVSSTSSTSSTSNGNLDSTIQYRPDLPLIIGQDFNVDPMAWIVAQCNHPDDKKIRFNVFDEIYIRNTNTIEALKELYKRYGQHQNGFAFYGDASGRARKTSASMSDYLLIQQAVQRGEFKGGRVYFLRANPRVQDRLAACNAMFCNARNERRLFIHPKCKHLRQDLQERQYKEGTNEPDDYGDIGHCSDALGYPIHRMFPIGVKLTDKDPSVHTSYASQSNTGQRIIPGMSPAIFR